MGKLRPTPPSANPARTKWAGGLFGPAVLSLLLGLITLGVFWPAVKCGFITYDDPIYFSRNIRVQNGLTTDGGIWAFSTGLMGNWHPLVWISYMLDVDLYGHGQAGPHWTNLLLHAGNAMLVFWLVWILTGARWRSLMVAALFALHPLRVESVAWVSERKDVLSGFFGLLALIMYARYARRAGERTGPQSPETTVSNEIFMPFRSANFCLALIFLVLGLMSKVMLVTLPFVMLLLDFWPLERFEGFGFRPSLRRLLLEKTPFFILALAAGAVTLVFHQTMGALTPLGTSSIAARLENAVVAWTCYVARMFWPARLALPYPWVEQWPLMVVAASAAFVTVVSLAAVWLRRTQPYLFVGWFCFLGMLVPVSGIVQWGDQSMADRFTYLPSIGFLMAAVWVIGDAVAEWRMPRWPMVVGGALVAGLCAMGTREQLTYWRSSETLFRRSIAVTRDNYVAYANLGLYFVGEGRLDDALNDFGKALAIKPDYALALNNLGATLFERGKVRDAGACIHQALKVKPDDASEHFNLGQVDMALGRLDEATGDFEAALRYSPDYLEARENLAMVLIRSGKSDQAIPQLEYVLKLNPRDVPALSDLGTALAMKGDLTGALTAFRSAVSYAPNLAETHFNLGNALLAEHQWDQAVGEYQVALKLKPDYAEARQRLNAMGVK